MNIDNELLTSYQQILSEISNNERNLISTIDIFDVLAAIIMAAITTIAALGIYYIAYYIVISLTSSVFFPTTVSLSTACIEWLKVKENKNLAIKKFESLLTSTFIVEMKVLVSIKDTHSKIKNILMKLFNNKQENIEQFIKN